MFLSLRMHARHWSNPLGQHFFQDQTKTTDRTSDPDAPNQTPATWRRRRDARRRARRARAGFEIDHSEPSGSRVAISRAAGPDGARNTSGATSNTTQEQTESERAGYAAAGDQAGPQAQPEIRQRPKHQRRNKRRHRKRKPYSPRNALIAGISRTACTRPAR